MKKNTLPLLSLMIFGVIACAATPAEKKLDEKISEQTPIHKSGEIAETGAQSFANMPGITEGQRLRLLQINQETADQARLIQTKISQTKSVLFQTLATPDYKKSDVRILKKKLIKLDQDRLNLMFDSLNKVENVLGRTATNKEEVYKDIYMHDPQQY